MVLKYSLYFICKLVFGALNFQFKFIQLVNRLILLIQFNLFLSNKQFVIKITIQFVFFYYRINNLYLILQDLYFLS